MLPVLVDSSPPSFPSVNMYFLVVLCCLNFCSFASSCFTCASLSRSRALSFWRLSESAARSFFSASISRIIILVRLWSPPTSTSKSLSVKADDEPGLRGSSSFPRGLNLPVLSLLAYLRGLRLGLLVLPPLPRGSQDAVPAVPLGGTGASGAVCARFWASICALATSRPSSRSAVFSHSATAWSRVTSSCPWMPCGPPPTCTPTLLLVFLGVRGVSRLP
mmetsp:Transcript_48633/g.118052  ORF Transcript_48633/g.118052 Transcript_48633/m.118052 type:complete len:219 (-) Transcript_48633:54-710(-)